jgi:hypothetical protein
VRRLAAVLVSPPSGVSSRLPSTESGKGKEDFLFFPCPERRRCRPSSSSSSSSLLNDTKSSASLDRGVLGLPCASPPAADVVVATTAAAAAASELEDMPLDFFFPG